jgi:hypothetical protein
VRLLLSPVLCYCATHPHMLQTTDRDTAPEDRQQQQAVAPAGPDALNTNVQIRQVMQASTLATNPSLTFVGAGRAEWAQNRITSSVSHEHEPHKHAMAPTITIAGAPSPRQAAEVTSAVLDAAAAAAAGAAD